MSRRILLAEQPPPSVRERRRGLPSASARRNASAGDNCALPVISTACDGDDRAGRAIEPCVTRREPHRVQAAANGFRTAERYRGVVSLMRPCNGTSTSGYRRRGEQLTSGRRTRHV